MRRGAAAPNGLLAGHPAQVLTQLASVLIVLAYSGGATFVILKLLALVMPLRIADRDEKLGLDVSDHGEEAYTHGDGAILVKPKATAGRPEPRPTSSRCRAEAAL